MIETLSKMYVPTFGKWTEIFFLVGVWAVLFKTMYVSSASNSRLTADLLGLAHLVKYTPTDPQRRPRWIRTFCVIYPLLGFLLYVFVRDP